ncbi:hypothetical protein ACVMFA_009132 [Bradyrhizobium liaoningense]
MLVAGAGVGEIKRLARVAAAGAGSRRHRLLPAAECARRARRVRVLVRIERIAAAARAGCAGRRLLLNDRRRGGDLRLLVVRLRGRLLLAIARRDLGWCYLGGRHRRNVRCLAGRGLRTAFERTQPLLELAIAILQLFVLAGELAQLVLQPLDPHLGVGIIRLREDRLRKCGRAQREQRGGRHGAGKDLNSG